MAAQTPVPYAQAASTIDATTFGNAINPIIKNVVDPAVEFMFALAIVVFAYGVLQIVWGGEDARKQAKASMLYGVIGMFVMVVAWGIIYLVSNTLGQFK